MAVRITKLDKTHSRRINRVLDHLTQTSDILGCTDSDGRMKYLLCEVHHAFHFGTPASENDAGVDKFLETTAPQFGTYQFVELFDPGFDNLCQGLPRKFSRRAISNAGDFNTLAAIGKLRECTTILLLKILGRLCRCAQRYRDIVGYLISGNGDNCRVLDRPLGINGYIGGTTTNVDQAYAQFLLIVCEYRLAGGQLLQDNVRRLPVRSA